MNYLTAEDIRVAFKIGRTKAYKIARAIGVKDNGTLRVSQEAWQRWLDERHNGIDAGSLRPLPIEAATFKRSVVYFVQDGKTGPVKIGWTANFPQRWKALQLWSAQPLRCRLLVRGEKKLEQRLHKQFAAQRLHGEWFSWSPELETLITSVRG